jgi:hypothetical protein
MLLAPKERKCGGVGAEFGGRPNKQFFSAGAIALAAPQNSPLVEFRAAVSVTSFRTSVMLPAYLIGSNLLTPNS